MKKLVTLGIVLAVGYYVGKKVKERFIDKAEEKVDVEVKEEQPEVEVVDNVEEEIVPEENKEMTREEMIQEMAECVKNIQENDEYMQKIYDVCDEIFDTNNEEFEKLFNDLDM